MLQLRCLAPLSSSSSQWQLQAVLRLPPELRQLALRNFSTSASASQARHDRQGGGPSDGDKYGDVKNETPRAIARGMTEGSRAQERRRKRLSSQAARQTLANEGRQRQSTNHANGNKIFESRSIYGLIAGDGASNGNARSETRERPTRSSDSTGHPLSTRFQNSGQQRVSGMSERGRANNSSKERTRVAGRESLGIPQRLARLKKTLLESPDSVAEGPAIQRYLDLLEDALTSSTQAGAQDVALTLDNTMKEDIGKMTESAKRRRRRQRIALERRLNLVSESTKDHHAQGSGGQEVPHQPLDDSSGPAPNDVHATQGSSPSAVNDASVNAHHYSGDSTQDLATFADLKLQIHELTSLLKVLISQQNSDQGTLSEVIEKTSDFVAAISPAVAQGPASSNGNGRYQAMQKQPMEFPSLPHEVEHGSMRDRVDRSALPEIDSVPEQVGEAIKATEETASDSAAAGDEFGSLYDQLFPEESTRLHKPPSTEVPIPRLPLFDAADPALQPASDAKTTSKSEQLAELYDSQHDNRKPILILRGASKSLTEDDFRRAMPRGRHIQEWTQRGEYERVIPVRDFWTLARTGDYYIVFKHAAAADAFLQHARRCFNLMGEHTPTGLTSALRPAPKGLLSDGAEDEAELVKNFTLLAPSMGFSLERAGKGIKGEVLRKGGYPQALSGGLTPETPQVVLELDGGNMPNWFQMRDAIVKDGNRRGVPWSLLPGELAIRRLNMKRAISAQSKVEEGQRDGDGESSQQTNGQFGDERDFNDAASLAQDRMGRGHNGQRWIIAFQERQEAQRFARMWHMWGFPWAESDWKRDVAFKGVTRVKAEVLW